MLKPWTILYSQIPSHHLSHTAKCRYFQKNRQLQIKFDNGDIYAYTKVPWSVYMGFRRAKSHGAYFSRHIRNAFAYQKLSGDNAGIKELSI